MDPRELHRRAVRYFADLVAGVGPDQWSGTTPCADWDVRALVNHLTYEERWTPPMLAGRTIAEVGDRYEGDLLGADPVGACRSAAAEAVSAGDAADPERIVHLSFGDVPAAEYLHQLAADHLVHGWDLAAATGADRRLDPAVVAAVTDWFDDREDLYRGAGAIGPAVATTGDGQDALLGRFGRDPGWTP